MDEQASWKTHGFMILMFGGIVLLCSIFFVLGMLVGRSQGQKMAAAAAAGSAAHAGTGDGNSELPFTEPPPPKPAPPVEEAPAPGNPQTDAPPPVPPPPSTNWQVSAWSRQSDAERKLEDVKRQGFPAFIRPPAADESVALYRILVGPFADSDEAEVAKKRLETLGYEVIKR